MDNTCISQVTDEDVQEGFAHAVCKRPLDWVAATLQELRGDFAAGSSIPFDYVARRPAFPYSSRTVYLAPAGATSTIIWLPTDFNQLLAKLSERTGEVIPYISVYVPMRSWLLIVFDHGEVAYEIYDPEDKIRTNAWTGDDMEGLGPRRFQALTDFLGFIRPWYEPVDRMWTAGRWDNPRFRQGLMLRSDCKFRWSLRLTGASHSIDAIGSAPDWAQKLVTR